MPSSPVLLTPTDERRRMLSQNYSGELKRIPGNTWATHARLRLKKTPLVRIPPPRRITSSTLRSIAIRNETDGSRKALPASILIGGTTFIVGFQRPGKSPRTLPRNCFWGYKNAARKCSCFSFGSFRQALRFGNHTLRNKASFGDFRCSQYALRHKPTRPCRAYTCPRHRGGGGNHDDAELFGRT